MERANKRFNIHRRIPEDRKKSNRKKVLRHNARKCS